MTRYELTDGTGYIIAGEAEEIKVTERAIYKHYNKGVSDLAPAVCGRPRFNRVKIYGLLIDTEQNIYYILTADTVLRFMFGGLFSSK